ncbi:MAG: hypothetical protein JXR51_00200 [Bacteroidales bacterium]|nr:hypothetical protein [Bacteroidales bacterium]MBN2755561.1 hypothetical protein [Bacteroidales bacterium]
MSALKNLIIAIKFIFRKRLNISDEVINYKIKSINYFADIESINNYNIVVSDFKTNISKKAHPLFYTKISWNIIENLNELLETKIDDAILKTIIHQSENIEFYDVLTANTNIKVESKIWEIKKHKKGTKMLIRVDYFTDNKLIATEYSGGLLFGVKLIGENKNLGEIKKFSTTTENSIFENKINIDKNLPYLYAEKAEIDAPIHTNPKFAKSIGLPDIILQGTCTFAKSISSIIHNNLNINTLKIKSVSAKFTGIVLTPNIISVKISNKTENQILFNVYNNKNEAVIKGGEIIYEL